MNLKLNLTSSLAFLTPAVGLALAAGSILAAGALCACTTASSHDGTGGSSGSGGSSSSTGGSSAGSGGSGGAQSGTGGAQSGAGGAAGAGQSGGASGTGGAAGGGATLTCPSDATFCSGFEDPGQPAGSSYKVNAAPGDWTRDFAIDTTVHNSGNSSLRVKSMTEAGTSGSAYKMLAVPATSGKFWVRFFVRSDMDMGGVDHNAFVEAAGSDDPNDAVTLEFAEDAGLGFNSHDDDRWPANYGRLTNGTVMPFTLSANTWHCVEISFDSTARTQMLYMNGTQQINVTDYPTAASITKPFAEFRFGFYQFHGPARQMWYDDVVVSPNRQPCP